MTYAVALQSGDISTATSVECPGNFGRVAAILSSTDSVE